MKANMDPDFWEQAKLMRKLGQRKLCLAEPLSECAGQIIGAHTVPRSQLKQIAPNGHVYGIDCSPEGIAKTSGKLSIQKIGVANFSVLNCFCAKHDKDLFRPIEDEPLTFTPLQVALLHYRATAQEFYKKLNGLEVALNHLEYARKKFHSGPKVETVEAIIHGTKLGVRDITRAFKECEAALSAEDYSLFRAVIVRFKKKPTVMTVGGFAPEYDYDGRQLETLGEEHIHSDHVSLSILLSGEGTVVQIAWLKSSAHGNSFAKSFLEQPTDKLSTLAIQTAFEHIENTCVDMNWWDNELRQVERDTLMRRIQAGGSPFHARHANCLQYCGITFADWEYMSHECSNF